MYTYLILHTKSFPEVYFILKFKIQYKYHYLYKTNYLF